MFTFNNPYYSQRMPILAENIVSTSQPLATEAGLAALRKGGNAVDAVLAAAITLTVVEPTSNGVGGDAFALLWDGSELVGLNSSGRSPQSMSLENFKSQTIPPILGWKTVTVPGAVKAWWELSCRYGNLPFSHLFENAIQYARYGFYVSPITAKAWSVAEEKYSDFTEFRKQFLINGTAPKTGQKFVLPALASTLETIALTNGCAFYQGVLAEKITAQAKKDGGYLSMEDLAAHQANWVQPIKQNFAHNNIYELPPNGQGLAALIALGILQNLSIEQYGIDSFESIHLQIEAMKIALYYSHKFIADRDFMTVSIEELLADNFLKDCSSKISFSKALDIRSEVFNEQGTVYLTAADKNGMMVSFIQSNYMGFGSGVVIKDTGISLHNRGSGFSLDSGHPNCYAPGKRPFHTIIPGFIMDKHDKQPICSFGVMGGPMQAQGHLQMMIRLLIYKQDPQTAIDAPRWFVDANTSFISVEAGLLSDDIQVGLSKLGHNITGVNDAADMFGGAQIIWRNNSGYIAGSDPRKDGQASGF